MSRSLSENAMPLSMPVDSTTDITIANNRAMTILLDDQHQLIWYMGEAAKPLNGPHISTFDRKGIREQILRQQKMVQQATGKRLIVLVKPGNESRYIDLVNILDELSTANVKQYSITEPLTEDMNMLKKF